jgi:hypothetical protein
MSFPRCGWPVLPAKRCLPSGSTALFICALGRQGSAIHHATIPSCFSIILFVRSNIRMAHGFVYLVRLWDEVGTLLFLKSTVTS